MGWWVGGMGWWGEWRSHREHRVRQVGIRWIMQNSVLGPRASLVVKVSSKKYLQEDLAFTDWALDSADVQALDNATVPKGQQDGRPSWGCAK